MRSSRLSFIATLLLLVILVGGLGWMTQSATRQERLNRALIASIKNDDKKTALSADRGSQP